MGSGRNLIYTGDCRIVDARGETLSHGAEAMLLADLDRARVRETRTDVPVLSQRLATFRTRVASDGG